MSEEYKKKAVIIGAGPAGLTAAYELLNDKTDIIPIIIEKLDIIGGISRTIRHNDNYVELGPHRLFSKNKKVLDLWQDLLPLQGVVPIDDKTLNRKITLSQNGPDPDKTDRVMLKRKRFSRIYYKNKFFDYPISLSIATIKNLGIVYTLFAGLSYIKSSFFKKNEKNLEDFLINRFGKVLYETFFEYYTKKVWGRNPDNISKDWGGQRIKKISLLGVILNALFRNSKNNDVSLIDEYYYPKFGCGQLWNILAENIKNKGGEILLNTEVIGFKNNDSKITELIIKNRDGKISSLQADIVISSMPIKELIAGLENSPLEIRQISDNLQYRNYIIVGFYLDKFNLKDNTKIKTFNNWCPDSWIYLQDRNMTAGRLQIMNNFSPYMVKDYQNKVFMNFEYFTSENEKLWNATDEELYDIAIEDLKKLNIATEDNILDRLIVRVPKAYPAYFDVYKDIDKVKDYLNSFENLYCIGRNGQHKYNNMDHSMLSGIEVADIIKNCRDKKSIWDVNTEQLYQEK